MDGEGEKANHAPQVKEGRRTALDEHIGRRIKHRRTLLGWTMNHLAERVGPDGIKFQQIQKYECGANRVTSSRLYELALAMDVPVAYFFEGYNGAEVSERVALDRTEKLRGSIGESISSGMSVEAVLAVALEVSASLKK